MNHDATIASYGVISYDAINNDVISHDVISYDDKDAVSDSSIKHNMMYLEKQTVRSYSIKMIMMMIFMSVASSFINIRG